MKSRKLITIFMIVALLLTAAAASACADDITAAAVINEDGSISVVNESADTGSSGTETAATGAETSSVSAETTASGEAAGTEAEQTFSPDTPAPTIVKHPGSEYDHAAGDSVLFTAACSENVTANWYFNDGVPVSQIGTVYPGVSATVATTIYNGVYPGTKLTISNLTRASSGMTVYVEFSTSYGIIKSDAATITVTRGTDAVVAATATPTALPTATPTAAPTSTPAAAATPVPTAVPVQTTGIDIPAAAADAPAAQETVSSTGTAVDLSGYSFTDTAGTGSGYQFTSEKQAEWTAPGATAAVAACAVIAVIALLLMALYSMGVLRFRALERMIGGADYVSPFDEEDYAEDEDT